MDTRDKRLTPSGRVPSEPNMQVIPIRTEIGRKIREAMLHHLYGKDPN